MPRRLLALALAASTCLPVALTGPVLAGANPPEPPGTTTPSSPAQATVERYLREMINADRVARGLRPLVSDSRLQSVARARAGKLADLGVLSHTAAGDLSSQLASADVQWYAWGEDLGWSGYSWGYSAARSLYSLWKHSSAHWALLMSPNFNYYGVGVGYQWSGRATYASIVFSDSRDHTSPTRAMKSLTRSGTTIHFTWSGSDVRLQRRTAGLRSFDVEYRVDGGAWRIIKSGTTGTSLTLSGRAHGHTYWIRVRARDNAGNLSSWSGAKYVVVP